MAQCEMYSIKGTVSIGKNANQQASVKEARRLNIADKAKTEKKMNSLLLIGVFCIAGDQLIEGCLITNCPRGGKRSGKMSHLEAANVKPCISCGPGRTGQCFGPNICCGPFGCLIGTAETLKCQKDGFFHETEPCIAGNSPCRRNTGRCAADGVCCSQDACHSDKSCNFDEKSRDLALFDVYNLLSYQPPMEYVTE